MPGEHTIDVRRINNPSTWPQLPRWMSFSALLEIEACPRRWALKSATYPSVWNGRGYPRIPQSAAIEVSAGGQLPPHGAE
jgi:hypothetical protein